MFDIHKTALVSDHISWHFRVEYLNISCFFVIHPYVLIILVHTYYWVIHKIGGTFTTIIITCFVTTIKFYLMYLCQILKIFVQCLHIISKPSNICWIFLTYFRTCIQYHVMYISLMISYISYTLYIMYT